MPVHIKQVVKPVVIILSILAENEGRARATEIIKKLNNWSISSIYTNLHNAMIEGLIVKNGKYYVLTEKGKEFLKQAVEEMKRIVETTTV